MTGEHKNSITLWRVPQEVRRGLRIAAIEEGRPMREIIIDVLENYLNQRGKEEKGGYTSAKIYNPEGRG